MTVRTQIQSLYWRKQYPVGTRVLMACSADNPRQVEGTIKEWAPVAGSVYVTGFCWMDVQTFLSLLVDVLPPKV